MSWLTLLATQDFTKVRRSPYPQGAEEGEYKIVKVIVFLCCFFLIYREREGHSRPWNKDAPCLKKSRCAGKTKAKEVKRGDGATLQGRLASKALKCVLYTARERGVL